MNEEYIFNNNLFWNVWIIGLTVLNILGCWWLISWATRKRKDEAAAGEVTGHTWDENLAEFNNPLPRWWLWLFHITLVFGLVYLTLYPGWGTFRGVLKWTHQDAYAKEMQAADERFGPLFAQYAAKPVTELAGDPEAIKIGQRLFVNYCASCHGSDAGGGPGYPNLRDADWLYGGTPEAIQASILDGRKGAMPAWEAVLQDKGVEEVAAYVQSLSGRDVDATLAAAGQTHFQTYCVACHGADGGGNTALGAPSLKDTTWLYGGTANAIKTSIAKGRNGQMPAHREFLGEDKVHLLATYVYSLSQSN